MKSNFKINILSLFILFISLTSCGYNKVNTTDSERYKILSFKSSGNQRAAYIIKNEIGLYSQKDSDNTLSIFLNVDKKKEVKEKNISNKVSKYNIILKVQLSLTDKDAKQIDYTFSRSSELLVSDSPSETNEEENRIIEVLAETIANKITQTINIKYRK